MKYLLDTNICIYIIKQKPPVVLERLQKVKVNEIGISVITLAELEYGVAKSSFPERNKLALVQFLAPFEILPFSETAAAIYGRIRSDLEKKGQIIGSYDLFIGAQALSGKLTLVTNNEREFQRIPGITIENWAVL
jgi:tRNA(fMet)-specific endonuclease VapC